MCFLKTLGRALLWLECLSSLLLAFSLSRSVFTHISLPPSLPLSLSLSLSLSLPLTHALARLHSIAASLFLHPYSSSPSFSSFFTVNGFYLSPTHTLTHSLTHTQHTHSLTHSPTPH